MGGDRNLLGNVVNQRGGTVGATDVDLTLGNGALTNNGTVTVAGGNLDIAGAEVLAGAGTIQANLFNNGQLSIGAPIGSLNLTGNYQQGSGATLNLAIGGATGSSSSQLEVGGSAALDGSLNLMFANGFVPGVGDAFQVVAANRVGGTFASLTAPAGFTFRATYGSTSVAVTETAISRKLSVVPSTGGDTGTVTAQISLPSPVVSGAGVKLARPGYPDIPGLNVSVGPDGLSLSATFELAGQADGERDVVVASPNGTQFTLPGGFTIEPGQGPNLWTTVIGRTSVRVGTPTIVTISYGNTSNVDVYGAVLFIHVPRCVVLPVAGLAQPPSGSLPSWLDANIVTTATDSVIPVWIYDVAAGSERSVDLGVICGATGDVSYRADLLPPPPSQFARTGNWSTTPDYVNSLAEAIAVGVVRAERAASRPAVARSAANPADSGLDEHHSGCLQFDQDAAAFDACVQEQQQVVNEIRDTATPLLNPVDWGVMIAQTAVGLTAIFGQGAIATISGILSDGAEIWDPINIEILKASRRARAVFDQHWGSAHDPNAKIGVQGSAPQRYVVPGAPLQYGVFFENQATATLPAQRIVVTDQLDPTKVDLNTFALGEISFGSATLQPPRGASTFAKDLDLRPATNLIVRVNAGLDPSTGLVTWTLTSIDPATGLPPTDPTAGFLPPDTSPPAGEGGVLFSVLPKAGLANGAQIRNQATIAFDANTPITTAPWLNTIDGSTPTSQVAPLPGVESSSNFQVQWSGTDAFSSVADFDIYVSVNGGPFTPWLLETAATSATFPGQPGDTYAFYSLARSQVGNREPAKSAAEAQTTVSQPTAISYTGPATQDVHDPVTVSAMLTAIPQNAPLAGHTLTLGVGSQICTTGPTDANGTASCVLTSLAQPAGNYSATAAFAGSGLYLASNDAAPFTVRLEETALVYTGPTTADYHDTATVSARLTEDGTAPLGGETITFTLGGGGASQVCSGVTDAAGNASCTVTPTDAASSVTVQASFAGDGNFVPASDSKSFAITPEETTLHYAGPTVIATGQPVTLSAVLKEDSTTPVDGRTVSFTLGGASPQTCSSQTDASGTAICSLTVNQALGPGTVLASFSSDGSYQAAQDKEPTLVFAYLSSGAFVVGDESATRSVTYWGARWAGQNALSGGAAPDAFKGFAASTSSSPPACGSSASWTTGPGSSSGSPSSVPSYMAVLVTDSVTKSGSTISGNTVHIVVVQTDAGYANDPGHPGMGKVVAQVC
jgi:hypothetical protein